MASNRDAGNWRGRDRAMLTFGRCGARLFQSHITAEKTLPTVSRVSNIFLDVLLEEERKRLRLSSNKFVQTCDGGVEYKERFIVLCRKSDATKHVTSAYVSPSVAIFLVLLE